MPTETNSNVENIESVKSDDGEEVPVANDGTYSSLVEGEPIDSTGTLIVLDTRGKTILDLSITGTGSADYALEASPNGDDWFGPFDSWSGVDTITETYRIGARYVRIRVSSAAPADSTSTSYMEVS